MCTKNIKMWKEQKCLRAIWYHQHFFFSVLARLFCCWSPPSSLEPKPGSRWQIFSQFNETFYFKNPLGGENSQTDFKARWWNGEEDSRASIPALIIHKQIPSQHFVDENLEEAKMFLRDDFFFFCGAYCQRVDNGGKIARNSLFISKYTFDETFIDCDFLYAKSFLFPFASNDAILVGEKEEKVQANCKTFRLFPAPI